MTRTRSNFLQQKVDLLGLRMDRRIRERDILLIEARAVNEVWTKAHKELNESIEHTLGQWVKDKLEREREMKELKEAFADLETTLLQYQSVFGELPDSEETAQ